MKVRHLIDHLKEANPEAEVRVVIPKLETSAEVTVSSSGDDEFYFLYTPELQLED